MRHKGCQTDSPNPPVVCHLSSVHWANDPRIFHKQCRTLVEAGYQVVLLAVGKQRAEENRDGMRVKVFPRVDRYLTRWLRICPQVYRAARAERAAIYHVHDPELIPWGLALRLRTRARIVFDMHEYYSEFFAARLNRPVLSGLVRWLSRLAIEWIPCRFYDAVVFATESLHREFPKARRGIALRNLPHTFAPLETDADEDQSEREFDVVFVGTVTAPRLKFMLRAAELVAQKRPRFRWLFVGLERALLEWVERNYDPRFVAEHLCLRGRVPFEEVARSFRRCRIGFNYHPPDKKHLAVAIPMKVLEYMAAGLAVVSSSLPELRDLLGSGNRYAMLIGSDSPDDYAAAITHLLENTEDAARMGREAQSLVRSKLAWQTCEAPKLRRLYADLLGGKNG